MKRKRTIRYHRPGDLSGLERELDAMSAAGWQAQRPGRILQTWVQGEGAWVHRLACSPGEGEAAFLDSQAAAGWEPAARRRGWILFRKPADKAEPGEQLPDRRDSVRARFAKRIARLEALRRWMLILAALLLIGGYASALKPVLWGAVLPLSAALLFTYLIKFYEEGPAR